MRSSSSWPRSTLGDRKSHNKKTEADEGGRLAREIHAYGSPAPLNFDVRLFIYETTPGSA